MNMKLLLLSVFLLGLTTVYAKPIFVQEQIQRVTPLDIKDWLVAFLDGFQINKYANATVECRADGGVFYDFAAAGVQNYFNHHYFEGTLNISDALGEMSLLSRACYDTSEELLNAFDKYKNQFKGIGDFISKV